MSQELIEGIIKEEKEIIGQVAIRRAQETDGLTVDDDGHVQSIEGDDEEVMKRLVDNYKSVVGKAVATAIRKFESEQSDVPEELEEVIEQCLGDIED
ncbi:MAG: hypothetical protein SVU32_08780 [Candidatus Nanohaloarchaea archaeon]|nr:hypothetical protein [Candidatus Nanohaloarchaea archaeon]